MFEFDLISLLYSLMDVSLRTFFFTNTGIISNTEEFVPAVSHSCCRQAKIS